jgi:hypothetical protein
MKKSTYKIQSKVWPYPGMAGWHFLTVPKKESEAIKKVHGAHARGWGSLPVTAVIGKTSWKTSIFPDRQSGTYLLPLKVAVRRSEGVDAGDSVSYSITILLHGTR